jgi:hypothetical protein
MKAGCKCPVVPRPMPLVAKLSVHRIPGYPAVAVAIWGMLAVTLAEAGPAQPFPDPQWPRAIPAVPSERARAYDAWLRSNAGDAWASVVIQGSYLIYEGAGPRCSVVEENDCGSLLKPLQATVLGAALYQGRLASIDENAMPYWKDPFPTPYENDRRITFRQFAEFRDRWNEPEPPGTYRYNNSGATAAGACIGGLFGPVQGSHPRGIAEAARREVMVKIGADWDLSYSAADFSANSGNPGPRLILKSGVSELAKLGYLWLRHGRWGADRLFSEDYWRDAVTDWSPHTGDTRFGFCGHYGYWWFVNDGRVWLPGLPEDAFYAIGNGEPKRATMLLIIPSLDTVAVLSMERLSDDKRWDVILNSRVPSNEGPRRWSLEIPKLVGP